MPFSLSSLTSRRYKYEPLDPRKKEIRVIRVSAEGPGKNAGYVPVVTGVRGLVQIVSLDAKDIGYTAISYTWERNARMKKLPIGVGKQTLDVSESVYDMLMHFVGHTHSGALWIDQICINQKDSKEKASQVRIMDQIYKKAFRTRIWLGFPGEDSDLALGLVEQADKHIFQRVLGADIPSGTATRSQSRLQSVGQTVVDPRDTRPWRALRALLCRQWWTRTWIIQEAWLSKPAACLVMCGLSSMHLRQFANLHTWFMQELENHHLLPSYIRHVFRGIPFMEFISRQTGIFLGLEKLELVPLMHYINNAGCGCPRDRIFALLSLCAEKYQQNIEIDYDSTDRVIFLRVFPYLIRTAGLAAIQLGKLRKTQNFGLPTWVPDLGTEFSSGQWFQHFVDTFPWAREKYPRLSNAKIPDGSNPWRADGGPAEWKGYAYPQWQMPQKDVPGEFDIRFSEDYEVLACLGIAFDTVELVEPASLYSRKDIDAAVQAVQDFDIDIGRKGIEKLTRFALSYNVNPYPDKRSAVLLTLVANRVGPDRKTPRPQEVVRMANGQDGPEKVGAWFQETSLKCNERTFVITKMGYFGLAPPNARAGDLIVVLGTAHVPFVLRRQDERYFQFVGDSYVYGISEGEIFGWAKANGRAIEEFWLR